ncbi:MAG: hypothetical protein Q9M92_01950 [Enterobacterales bacterium]|nr:hypothetical protein [Enterobacterales bacterium]
MKLTLCFFIKFMVFNLFFQNLSASEIASILDISSNENEFIGKIIKTEGVLCAEKDGVALVISAEACKNGFITMGIGLDVGEEIFNKRELYGHLKPVSVKGRLVSKKNIVSLHKINFRNILTNVTMSKLPLLNYDVVKIDRKEEYLNFIDLFISSVRKGDKDYLASVLSIDKSYLNDDNRMSWVMFKSPVALKYIFEENKQIDLYQSANKEDGEYEYLACISKSETYYRTLGEMPDASESEKSTCFEFYRGEDNKFKVNSAYLGAY